MRTLNLIALPLAVLTTLTACGGGGELLEKSTLAVIGDIPYGTTPTDTAQLIANPKFISAINADADVSLLLHVGDTHSGKSYCTQAYNQVIFDQWKAYRMPVVYTLGDNEWTDCHKKAEGGGVYNAATGAIDYVLDSSGQPVDYAKGDPLANLALVRSMFFSKPGQTLGSAMQVHTQAQEFDPAYPKDASYVENTWFRKSGVIFVNLNVPGGSNNDTDPWYGAPAMSAAQQQEVTERTAANVRWLNAAFAQATVTDAYGVVVQFQANVWDVDGKDAAHLTGYKPFVDALANNTKAFGKPVLLFNGDSHLYRSDNPLLKGAPCVSEAASGAPLTACATDDYNSQPNGYNVSNFHRIVVHGSTTPMEYLKLAVNPGTNAPHGNDAFGPFSWKRVQPAL